MNRFAVNNRSQAGRRSVRQPGANKKEGAMEKFWNTSGRLLDFLGNFVLVLVFTALAFSVGYHIGFSTGLDTKVTLVGEKYVMQAKGTGGR